MRPRTEHARNRRNTLTRVHSSVGYARRLTARDLLIALAVVGKVSRGLKNKSVLLAMRAKECGYRYCKLNITLSEMLS